MSKRIRYEILVYLLTVSLVFGPAVSTALAQNPIVPDGRTQTSVNVNGNITDVRTNTIHGATGYNSFERFNVPGGNTTNLYVPDSAKNLVNLVHNEKSTIDGILNSYKNGQIGGNVYFLNPHGMVIGQGGTVNVGSLHLVTPTKQFMEDLLSKGGTVSAVHEQRLFEGNVPLSETGVVSVKGKVNAVDTITVTANEANVDAGASMRAGRQVQVEFGSIVNTQGIQAGNELVVSPEGKISIVAAGNANVSGRVSVDGIQGEQAGNIDIKAGNDINVNAGAEISARGVGTNSDGGEVVIFADRNSNLEGGAVVDVSAEKGKGGFLEFSAVDTVNIVGNGLRSSAGGAILIDPTTVKWDGNSDSFLGDVDKIISSNGANLTVTGTDITLKNAIISSQNSDKTKAGNIDITAQNLTMIASSILANGTTESGDVKITLSGDAVWSLNLANIIDIDLPFSPLLAMFDMDGNSEIRGKNVNITLEPKRGKLVEVATEEIANITKNTIISALTIEDGGYSQTLSGDKGDVFANVAADIFDDLLGKLTGGASSDTYSIENKFAGVLNYVVADVLTDILDQAKTKADEGVEKLNVYLDDEIKKLVSKIEDIVHGKIRFEDVTSIANISGKIIAGEDVNITSTANANASIDNGGEGLGWSFSYLNAKSEININETAKIEAGKDVNIVSTANTKLDTKQKEENASSGLLSNVDIALAVGIANSTNSISVADGAAITAQGNISIKALTERSHSLSVEGGSGQSYMGLVVGVLVGHAKTDVIVSGALNSGKDVTLSATTDTKENSVSTTAEMRGGGDSDKNEVSEENAKKIQDATTGVFASLEGSGAGVGADAKLFDKFGLAGAVSVTYDDVKTNVALGGKIIAGADVKISANTVNEIVSTAFALIGEYKVGDDKVKKDNALALSTPIVIMNNSTSAVVNPGAIITTTGKVDVSAKTEIPLPREHAIYEIWDKLVKDKENITELLNKTGKAKEQIEELIGAVSDGTKDFGALIKELTGSNNIEELYTLIDEWFKDAKDQAQEIKELFTALKDNANEMKDLFTRIKDPNENGVKEVKDLLESLSKAKDSGTYEGLFDGLLNTWGQSSAQTDEFGGAAMVTFLDISNTTVAQIAGGSITASDLKVDAQTTMELANLVGSFAGAMTTKEGEKPKADDNTIQFNPVKGLSRKAWEKNYLEGIPQLIKGNSENTGDSVVGGAVGGALLLTILDSTTIARIDGGVINLTGGDLDVNAKTKVLDIGIAIGGGKSGSVGVNLMANPSFYDSYTLAKVDDAVKVTAKNVSIIADDVAYRIGVSGSLTNSSNVGVGVSGSFSIMLRDAHAVWGNLLDEFGELAYIKGDKDKESLADSVVESVVTDNVTIRSKLHGVNVIAAVAGVSNDDSKQVEVDKENAKAQSETENFKKLLEARDALVKYVNDPNVQKMRGVNPKNEAKYQEAIQKLNETQNAVNVHGKKEHNELGISGAIVVSYMDENSSAGISGNVKINAEDIKVEALNSIFDVTIGGAGVLQTGSDTNTGIAGGIAVNILDGSTVAYIQPKLDTARPTANQITYETLNVNAKRSGNIISVAAGAAGSTSGDGLEIGGSITVNLLDHDTFVRIQDANLQKKTNATGDVTATAINSAGIYSLGGGLAVGGSAAFGASVAFNYLGLNTHANISNSIIGARNLTLISGNASSIVTIALGGAAGKNAVGGTIAVVISNSTTAIDIYNSDITLSGSIVANALSQSAVGAKSYYDAVHKEIQDTDSKNTDEKNKKSGLTDGKFDIGAAEYEYDHEENKEIKKGMNEQADLGLAAHSPKIVTAALAVAVGNSTAVGANIAVNILTDTTSTTITGSTITSGDDARYTAETNGGIIAVGIGIAGSSGNVAVSGNVGVNIIGGSTAIAMRNNDELSSKGTFTAQAQNRSGIIGIGVNVAGSGGTAVGASIAYNQIAHGTKVLIDHTAITGATVNLKALNDAGLVSALLSVGGGGGTGVGASLAINTIGKLGTSQTKDDFGNNYLDEVKIDQFVDFDEADSTSENFDKDKVAKAKDSNTAESSEAEEDKLRTGIAKQFGSTGVIEAIGKSENVTQVVITNGSKVESKESGVNINAQNSGGILSIAIGAGGGGTAGVGAGLAYNNIGSGNGIITNDATIDSAAGLSARSDSTNRIIAVSVGMGGGGTAGIGAGVAVNNLSGKNQVSFTNTTTTAKNNISLYAHNSGEIISVVGGVGGGGGTGIGASVGVNLLKGSVLSDILGGTTTSVNGSVSVEAENASKIISVAFAGAGGGAAGIAGAVAVNLIHGTTAAQIGSSAQATTINSKTGVNIDAQSNGDIISVAVGAAGAGAAAVALDVAINIISRTTGVYLENALLSEQQNTDILHMLADSNHKIKSIIVGLSGSGVAAVNVLVGSNTIKGTTETVAKNSTVYAKDIDITAKNYSESLGVSVSIAGSGIAAVGIQTDIHTLLQTVQTVIDQSNLHATKGNLLIDAIDTKEVNSNTIGIAGSGIAGVSGAVSVLVFNGHNNIYVTNSTLRAHNDLTINATSKATLKQISGVIAIAGIAGVGIATGVNVFDQHTNIVTNTTTKMIAGRDISVTGRSESEIDRIDAYSVGGGLAGVAGTVIVSVVKNTSTVTLAGEIQSDNNVTIASESVLNTTSRVGGAAGGFVGVAGGTEVLVVGNNSTLSIAGTVKAGNNINLNSNLIRNVHSTTFAGSAGVVGVSAAVSVINMGGSVDKDQQEAFLESVAEVNKMAQNANGTTIGEVTNVSGGSVTLQIAGSLTTVSGDISAKAEVNNKVVQNVIGVGAGLVGAGAAVGVINVKDNIAASFTGTATAKGDFTLQGKSINAANINTIAGAGGIAGLSAAVSHANFTSNVNTNLGKNSAIRGSSVNVNAIQSFNGFDVDTDGGAVGAVGLGGAFSTLKLSGNATINIGDEVQIYSPNVTFRAEKNYNSIQANTFGLAGGISGGAGIETNLILSGNTKVMIGSTKIWSNEFDNPSAADSVLIEAVIRVSDTANTGNVDAGGLAAAAHGNTNLAMIFDTLINISGADILTGTISTDAWQTLDASAHHTTFAAGAAGVAGGDSLLTWTGSNKINVENSKFYSWWRDTSFTAGKGFSKLDAQTLVFNYSLVPVTTSGMTNATTFVNVVNDLTFANENFRPDEYYLRSAKDISLNTGLEILDLGAYDKFINIYNGESGDFVTGSFARAESSGNLNTKFRNLVSLNNTHLEAGYHWNSFVWIDSNGNIIDKSPWIDISQGYGLDDGGQVSIYTLFEKQINALKDKIADIEKYTENQRTAFLYEIEQLQRQLINYIVFEGGDPLKPQDNYPSVDVISITKTIEAAAGDIRIYADRVITGGRNNLTAHDDPYIEIVNDSEAFLEIAADLTIPNPLLGGGRILVNSNIVAADAANAAEYGFTVGNTRDILQSVGNGNRVTPYIRIENTYEGEGNTLASDLFLTGAMLLNPGGKIELNSVGSIWLNSSVVDARDIAIVTAGSFFQGYTEGLTTIAGNPFGSGTNISAEINAWFSEWLLFDGGKISKTTLKDLSDRLAVDLEQALKDFKRESDGLEYADAENAIKTAQKQYDDLVDKLDGLELQLNSYGDWGKYEVVNKDGEIEFKINDLKTNAEKLKGDAQKLIEDYMKQQENADTAEYNRLQGLINVEQATVDKWNAVISLCNQIPGVDAERELAAANWEKYARSVQIESILALQKKLNAFNGKEFSGELLIQSLAGYNDSVIALQNIVSTDSWKKVFENGFPPDVTDIETYLIENLRQKEGNKADMARIIHDYVESRQEYEVYLTIASTIFIEGQVTDYDHARVPDSTLDTHKEKKPTDVHGNPIIFESNKAANLVSNKESGIVAIIDTELPNNTGFIYGARSVYIAAETLDINGTIQSGTQKYEIDLSGAAVTQAIQDAIRGDKNNVDLTAFVFINIDGLTNGYDKDTHSFDSKGANDTFNSETGEGRQHMILPTVTWRDGAIHLGNIEAIGGDITLFGNIISTGGGKLVVADGYGDITITGNDTYNLVLGRVDTGLGAEGTIRIIDTAKGEPGNPLTTLYTRTNGIVNIEQYRLNGDEKVLVTDGISDTAFYNPTKNRWLETVIGISTSLRWDYIYERNTRRILFGVYDGLAKDHNDLTGVSGVATINRTQPVGTFLRQMEEGYFVDSDATLYGQYVRKADQSKETYTYKRSGFSLLGIGKITHRYEFTATQDFTETFTTWLNASQPIKIEFLGDDRDPGNIKITGGASVTLGSLVRSSDNLSINVGGDILAGTGVKDKPLLIAADINLTAKNIGMDNNPLKIETALGGTTINATANGVVNLDAVGPRLFVDTIKGHDVKIATTGDLLMKNGGTGITAGNTATISAGFGGISQENGDYFLMSAGGDVTATANGDIRIKHDGDLLINQIASYAGDLDIWVEGDILNRNPNFAVDPRSDAETMDFGNLGLIGGSEEYNVRLANRIAAYEQEFTEFYFAAWLEADFDAANYDPNYVFRYSDEQKEVFKNSLSSDADILNEEQNRTDAYHNAFKNAFDPMFSYKVTDAERESLTAFTAWTKEQLENQIVLPTFLLTQDAGTRNKTTSLIKEPNFIGNNITLYATGTIGSRDQEPTVTIPAGKDIEWLKAQPEWDTWRQTMAGAEWDDVTFNYKADGQTLESVSFKLYDDITIEATGWLKTETRDGATYLGSNSDVTINEIVSGTNGTTKGTESLRFKMSGNMIPMIHNTPQAHIYAKNAILEAAWGTLGGSANSPLLVNLTGGNADTGWITARGTEGMYLSFVDASNGAADVYVREIGSSKGDIHLTARTIVDAQAYLDFAKIGGRNIVLEALGGSIGTDSTWMWIKQATGGSLTVLAAGDVFLLDTGTALNIVSLIVGGSVDISARGGDLLASGALLDVMGNASFSAIGDMILSGTTARFGNVRFTAGKDFAILDSNVTAYGTMIQTAGQNNSIADSNITVHSNITRIAGNNMSTTGSRILTYGSLSEFAGNDLSTACSIITAHGNMTKIVGQDISVNGSNITVYGHVTETAWNNISLAASNITVYGHVTETVGNSIFLGDLRMLVHGTLTRVAGNGVFDTDSGFPSQVSAVGIIQDNTSIKGKIGADVAAYPFDWSFYMRTALPNNAGIYDNWLNTTEEDDDDMDKIIGGHWSEEEDILPVTLNDWQQIATPNAQESYFVTNNKVSAL